MLHHRIVDAVGRAGQKGLAIRADEIHVHRRAVHGGAALLDHLRPLPAQLLQIGRRPKQEHAGIPQVVAALQVSLGGIQIGFFDEAVQGEAVLPEGGTAAHVAVAGFRVSRHHAKCHQTPFAGQGQRRDNRPGKGLDIPDQVVRGQHQQQCLRVTGQLAQGRQSHRRRGVAALGLEQQRAGPEVDLAQLFGHHETVLLVADHHRRRSRQVVGARQGGLQHGQLPHQRQELLGVKLAGDGPEAAAYTAAQQYRSEHEIP